MTTWPATLPQCPIMNFSEQRQRNVVAFAPEVGPAKMRRRSTAVGVKTDLTFRMSTTQLAAFNTFYIDTLFDGTLPFDWAHPVTKVSYSWMFSDKDAPTIERVGPTSHRVSFSLMRLP